MVDPWEARNHRQALHRVAVRRHLPAAATPHLAVDSQNNLDFVRGLGCSTLDLRREESILVVLDYYWQNMAEGGLQCIELVRGLAVVRPLPSQCRGRAGDQSGDVGVL